MNLSIRSAIFSISSSVRSDVPLGFGGTFSSEFVTGVGCFGVFGDDGSQPISENERMIKRTNFSMWKVFLCRGYALFLFGPQKGAT